ncbi:hypothetical protein ACIO52_31955 [Nocardia sp. NPDC087230]|uniref:hypothetical protein n=1 Tax=Nocardia sp. NPDC087230 TaxID=3364331 RepID=UPI003812B997
MIDQVVDGATALGWVVLGLIAEHVLVWVWTRTRRQIRQWRARRRIRKKPE